MQIIFEAIGGTDRHFERVKEKIPPGSQIGAIYRHAA